MNQRDTSSITIHVLSIGDFGRAVTAHLKALGPRVLETVVNDHTVPLPHLWPLCDVIVLAGWRPSPNLCELVEELSYARQRPFVPVFQVAGLLRLGPVVVPGEGPCWTCWTQRLKQHAEWPDAEAALLEHYARQPDAGPRGFLEPFALMAAARLSQTIQQLSTRQAVAGQVWQIHMLTREITRSQVIGIHGCTRCGLHRAESARSFDPMREELAYLWASAGGKG